MQKNINEVENSQVKQENSKVRFKRKIASHKASNSQGGQSKAYQAAA
jgi:hypothetical protein